MAYRLKDCPKHHYHRKIVLDGAGEKVGVLWEGEWKPSQPSLSLHPEVPKDFKCRHIIYRDPETKKIFDFVTSDFKSSAQTIADTYKRRWAVELLFRWFKGHLKIRYFETRNPNAVKIQLTVAVLVQLLIQLYRTVTKFRGTLWGVSASASHYLGRRRHCNERLSKGLSPQTHDGSGSNNLKSCQFYRTAVKSTQVQKFENR